MDKSASRRQFLQNVTALGAVGGVSVALADGARGQQVSGCYPVLRSCTEMASTFFDPP
jgi:hypothetical protein